MAKGTKLQQIDPRQHRKAFRAAIAANIKAAIRRSAQSQNGIARFLGVTSGTLSAWVNGRTQPSLEEFAGLCYLLHDSSDRLLGLLADPKALRSFEEVNQGHVMNLDFILSRHTTTSRLSKEEQRHYEFMRQIRNVFAGLVTMRDEMERLGHGLPPDMLEGMKDRTAGEWYELVARLPADDETTTTAPAKRPRSQRPRRPTRTRSR